MGCGSSSAQHAIIVSPVVELPADESGVDGAAPQPRQRHRRERTQTVLQETQRGTLSLLDQPACVLVSDMQGFTSQTRAHGIIHFGSKILRMRQVLHPILLRHAPLVVSTEADNFLCVFETVEAGLRCAVDMMQCCHAYNSRLHGSARKMRLELGGIGLDFGSVTLEAPSGTLYGVAADGAFTLGEDTSDGEILLTHRVRDELARTNPAMLESFVKLTRKEDEALPFEHLQGHYYTATPRRKHKHGSNGNYVQRDAKQLKKDAEEEAKAEAVRLQQLYSWTWGDCEDATYIGSDCTLLTRRHALDLDPAALVALDAEISSRFLGERDVSVVMFGLHTGKVTERLGIGAAFTLKHRALELLDPIVADYGGRSVEDTFLVFEHEYEAVACALALSARIAAYNAEAAPDDRLQPKGFGIHAGTMLIVPGTNVHWGDCVSTASKLGEDLGQPGEVLVSDAVWKRVQALPCFAGHGNGGENGGTLTVVAKQLETSGVKFTAYSLSGTIDPSTLPRGSHSYASDNIAAEAVAGGGGVIADRTGTPATADTGSVPVNASPSLSSFNGHRPVGGSPSGGRHTEPPLVRTITAGAKLHSTVRVLDYARTGRRNSDLGSMFVEQPGAPVHVTSGVMSPNLAGKLLQHSPSIRAMQAAAAASSLDTDREGNKGRPAQPQGLALDAPPIDSPSAAASTALSMSPAARQHALRTKPSSRRSSQERGDPGPATGSLKEHRNSKRRSSGQAAAAAAAQVEARLHSEPAQAVTVVASPTLPSAIATADSPSHSAQGSSDATAAAAGAATAVAAGAAASAADPAVAAAAEPPSTDPVEPSAGGSMPPPSPGPAKLTPLPSTSTARGGSLHPLLNLRPLTLSGASPGGGTLGSRAPLPPISSSPTSPPGSLPGGNSAEATATTSMSSPTAALEADDASAASAAAADAAAAPALTAAH